MEIVGKKVVVIGAKRSGMALVRLVNDLKGIVKISEKDSKDCLEQDFVNWASKQNILFEFNGHTQDFIEDSDLIVLSPGVPFEADPVRWAQAKNIPVLGEIEFAAQYCGKPIIAITGSNGKTTVSTLISKILKKAGYKACLCGNVGFPFSDFVLGLGDTDYIVLELSSFQLESILDTSSLLNNKLNIKGFKPYISVILNFSQNHLDRHKNLEEYFYAKQRIYLNQGPQDYLVLNKKESHNPTISSKSKPQVVYFNARDNDQITNPNYLAASEVGRILGVDDRCCQEVFNEFEGVEHRLETVRSLNGVDFVNDSKATTAQAALWALENIDQPIVMICGGRDKNIDFSVLAESVKQKVKQMFVIGEARSKIRQAFNEVIHLEECEGLEDAVMKARDNATKGDCVLLSPMCTSFDMFKDFEERGRVFKQIVNELK